MTNSQTSVDLKIFDLNTFSYENPALKKYRIWAKFFLQILSNYLFYVPSELLPMLLILDYTSTMCFKISNQANSSNQHRTCEKKVMP